MCYNHVYHQDEEYIRTLRPSIKQIPELNRPLSLFRYSILPTTYVNNTLVIIFHPLTVPIIP